MHPYATDSTERTRVVAWLALIALALTYGVHRYTTYYGLAFPWWAETPSPFLIFGLLHVGFDRYAWRWRIVRWLGDLTIPDLAGSWDANIKSSHNQFSVALQADVTIEQTWTRMRVCLTTTSSISYSLVGAILIDHGGGTRLIYQYVNEPRPSSAETMNIHYGTSSLRLTSPTTLDGVYYTDHGRRENGELILAKKFVPFAS